MDEGKKNKKDWYFNLLCARDMLSLNLFACVMIYFILKIRSIIYGLGSYWILERYKHQTSFPCNAREIILVNKQGGSLATFDTYVESNDDLLVLTPRRIWPLSVIRFKDSIQKSYFIVFKNYTYFYWFFVI